MYGKEDGLVLVKDLFLHLKLAEIFEEFLDVKLINLSRFTSVMLDIIYFFIFSIIMRDGMHSTATHWIQFWLFFFFFF